MLTSLLARNVPVAKCFSTDCVVRYLVAATSFYMTKFKYHLCYYLNLFAILAKETVR